MCDLNTLIAIPKIELHCHLDGSVSVEFIKKEAKKQNININLDNILADEQCESLDEYLRCFDEILKVMQTEESLIESVVDVANQAQKDGIKYIELRFAPKFHMQKGMNIDNILHAVCKGAQQAEDQTHVMVRIIVCGMKHHSNEENIEIFKQIHSTELLKQYIVGVDLAGGEEDDSIPKHEAAIAFAKENNLNITLHAGECGCIKNIHDSIKLGAQRIGHGVAIFKDTEQFNDFQNKDTLLEICPLSNIQTNAINDIKDIDLALLKRMDIPYLINTDNRVVTQTNLVKEYQILLNNGLISIDEIKRINHEAVQYAFANVKDKEVLKERLK